MWLKAQACACGWKLPLSIAKQKNEQDASLHLGQILGEKE